MKHAPSLVLVGPMGAGKTTIGRRLAGRFGLRFVDVDAAIEADVGASVARILEREGEAGFRRREAAMLADVLAGPASIVATGGGAVLSDANRRALRERGFVVHLALAPEAQLQRLASDRTRPLLEVADRAAVLHRLARERDPLYAEVADLVFDTDARTDAQAADALAVLLETHWRPEAA